MSISHFTKYDEPYLQEMHPSHPLVYSICVLLVHFKKSIKKPCPLNLNFQKLNNIHI